MEKLNQKKGQSVAEYFIVMVVVLAAVLAAGFVSRIRSGLENYFNSAVEQMR